MVGWFVRPPAAAPVRHDALRSVGRVVLWTCAGLVFLRGITGILNPHSVGFTAPAPSAVSFPNDEAQAFAVSFVRRYLTVAPGRERSHARAIAPSLAEGLSDQTVVVVSPQSPGVSVAQATVARAVAVDGSRALVTVAASMTDRRTLYLTVPIAKDEHGGLAVYDLPSFSSPPRRTRISAPALPPISGADADAISDVTGRFLRAYLDGEGDGSLAYFLKPGARVAPLAPGLRLVAVDGIAEESSRGRTRVVSASVRVRESVSRAIYAQRYRVTLVRGDRWYVTSVAGGPSA